MKGEWQTALYPKKATLNVTCFSSEGFAFEIKKFFVPSQYFKKHLICLFLSDFVFSAAGSNQS